jgi:hypothetical protein
MAATTAGALKALIEGAGLSLSAYRDEAKDTATLPFVAIIEQIALVPDGVDPQVEGSPTDPIAGRETVQVSLWQQWRDPTTNAITESYTLPTSLQRVLKGARLATSPTRTWGVVFLSSRRILERETNRVQHAMTVEVVRDI